jgi:hypothetical protein
VSNDESSTVTFEYEPLRTLALVSIEELVRARDGLIEMDLHNMDFARP